VIESSYQGNGVFTVEAGALNTDTTTATVIKDRDSVDLLSTQKLALTKVGTGTLTLAGLNTYTGNTTINGGKLVLDYSGQLKFSIGADGVNNTITGSGAVQLDGIFLINLENANLTHGNSWQLVDVDNLTETYGLDFFVQSFDADEDGVTWSLVDGDKTWTFSEDTGVLSLSIVPTVTGFALWATTNAQGQTIAQDHDNDGVSNGIEYFMGLSGSAFTGNPAPDASRRISWPKGATYSGVYGIDYAVQTSSDLGTWTDVPVGQVTDGNILEYTIPAGSSAKFARLKVAGP
jgi:autotransporter-associated beta strand protein